MRQMFFQEDVKSNVSREDKTRNGEIWNKKIKIKIKLNAVMGETVQWKAYNELKYESLESDGYELIIEFIKNGFHILPNQQFRIFYENEDREEIDISKTSMLKEAVSYVFDQKSNVLRILLELSSSQEDKTRNGEMWNKKIKIKIKSRGEMGQMLKWKAYNKLKYDDLESNGYELMITFIKKEFNILPNQRFRIFYDDEESDEMDIIKTSILKEAISYVFSREGLVLFVLLELGAKPAS